MFYSLNAFTRLDRIRLGHGWLLAVTLAFLLAARCVTVYAQTEIITPPQVLPAPPPTDSTVQVAPAPLAAAPLDVVTIGLNFQGSELFVDSFSIPPDTMGAVGPNHIVQIINGRFDVYNKTTGAQLFTDSLDGFWINVVGLSIPTDTFDPRIVFDPASGRWFATSIDRGTPNNIYLGRSDTSDPTGDWDGIRFAADTVFPAEFHDYDTLGVDADGLYICTNDFGSVGNESCYSIPKADLVQATPSIARMTRFEATPPGLPSVNGSVQPALDFGSSDGRAALLGASFGTLVRGNIFGAGGAGASLGTVTGIVGDPGHSTAPAARQPSVFTIENVSPRIVANVFEQGNSLWAVHAVLGSFSNSAVRWYEINEVTNTVIQTGLIQNSNEDFYDPSIAVNALGNVVIGYTCSGPSLAPSACVSVGETSGGVTTFETPLVLQLGAGPYFQDAGTGRNRWGDYSATVIDPADPCTFWTFQEFVAVSGGGTGGSWGIQITELTFNSCTGDTVTDLLYTPVTPCRIVDTRNPGPVSGAFAPNESREFFVYGTTEISSQGGNAAGCPSPRGEPSAVHLNITTVPLAGNGFFTAFPANVSPPLTSILNYKTGVQNIANAATVKTFRAFGPREIEVLNRGGTAHLIIDVLGYYYPIP